MGFYELTKRERVDKVAEINAQLSADLKSGHVKKVKALFDDEDTYIRKSAYLAIGKIYLQNKSLQPVIIRMLDQLLKSESFKIRQTVINSAGEIGKKDFKSVEHIFNSGLFDLHHSPRNAVIGSVKKMGEINPKAILSWAKKYLRHEDKEIRREILHGIELRGRKYPEDILPLLKELQNDRTARVRNTLVHVMGQISYKENCLQTVIADLKQWQNHELVADVLEEIIDVHHRYRSFAAMTQEEAKKYIDKHYFKNK